jgi:hypothetical protein
VWFFYSFATFANSLIQPAFFQENNKSPNRNKFATPKSPSRKTKARLAKTNLNKTSFNELNERNRNEKEKSETITSEKAVANANALNTQNSNIHSGITLQKQSAGKPIHSMHLFNIFFLLSPNNLTYFICDLFRGINVFVARPRDSISAFESI